MTSSYQEQTEQAVCYRHRNRPTAVRCSNCDRPICADCMRSTPVGFRCPECAPTSRFAMADDLIVTKTIVAINVIVFLVGIATQMSNGSSLAIMGAGSGNTLLEKGWLVTDLVDAGDWWRIFTSGFLHAGLLHVGLNMFFVYSFGGLLEPALGRLRFALLYTAGIIGGAIGAMLLSGPMTATVGASGAAFALLGAALVMARLRGHSELVSNLLMIAVLNFGFTFAASGISVGGHIGGFITGAVCGVLAYGPLARQKTALNISLAVLCVVLFAAAIGVSHLMADDTLTLLNGA